MVAEDWLRVCVYSVCVCVETLWFNLCVFVLRACV